MAFYLDEERGPIARDALLQKKRARKTQARGQQRLGMRTENGGAL